MPRPRRISWGEVIALANPAVTVNTMTLQNDMKVDGVTVLTYRIEFPKFAAQAYQMALFIINQHYRAEALEFQSHVERELYPQAVAQYRDSVANGTPVMVYEALVTFHVTYNDCCIISLYTDAYEFTGGAHGNTERESQTWNLQKRRELELSELFGCDLNPEQYILAAVRSAIAADPSSYFENYEELIAENFDDDHFYCTPQGIVVYYEQYEIAPYASGIPEFLIPYTNCVYDPKRTCFVRSMRV
jgi:hypothetical protein